MSLLVQTSRSLEISLSMLAANRIERAVGDHANGDLAGTETGIYGPPVAPP
jgi:hypothetical protein